MRNKSVFPICLCAAICCGLPNALAQELPSILDRTAAAVTLEKERSPASEQGAIAVRFRLPAAMIVNALNREYTDTSQVDRTVLGTHSRGQAVCDGEVRCNLMQSASGAQVECCISGQVHSSTCGTNGPAIIQSQATTWYSANKTLLFDGRRFSSPPAVVSSRTALEIIGIGSTVPNLRGRIVRRVAKQRAAESLPQAEAITSQLTNQELRQRIDIEFDARIAALNERLMGRLEALGTLSETGELLNVRSYEDCLEVTLAPSDVLLEATPKIARGSAEQYIELWLYFCDGNIPDVAVANLLTSVPVWLATYFTKSQTLSRLAEHKVEIERHGNWIVVHLLDLGPQDE